MMINYPLVSVAVITYNEIDFIKNSLESILSQDYPNFEVVISDDCSTDGTADILKEFKSNYPEKIKLLLAEKNQGITKNSTKAHLNCHGKYIAWMAGDDQMLPGKLTAQVEYMENHPDCNICYHNLEVVNSLTNEFLHYYNNSNNSYSGKVEKLIKYGTFNGACSNMVRKSKAPDYGFDERVPIASDWLYWIETLINGGEIHFINKVLGRYGKHNSNISLVRKNDTNLDHLITCSILMVKHPEFVHEILYKESLIFRKLSRINKDNYRYLLIYSLKLNFNIKILLLLILNLISFNRIKN